MKSVHSTNINSDKIVPSPTVPTVRPQLSTQLSTNSDKIVLSPTVPQLSHNCPIMNVEIGNEEAQDGQESLRDE